jgi:hypothetical protein
MATATLPPPQDPQLRAIDLERASYGIGSGLASVVVKPETDVEKLKRLAKEAGGKG